MKISFDCFLSSRGGLKMGKLTNLGPLPAPGVHKS